MFSEVTRNVREKRRLWVKRRTDGGRGYRANGGGCVMVHVLCPDEIDEGTLFSLLGALSVRLKKLTEERKYGTHASHLRKKKSFSATTKVSNKDL